MMVLGVVGVAVLTGGDVLGAGFRSSVGLAFGLDPLSGFFLSVLALTAVPTLIFARDYLPGSHGARALGALTAAFLLSLVGVLAARDVIGFLGFWELMTLVPATAILVSRRDREVRSAVYAYLAITHLGGAGVWIALLALAHHGAIGDPAALAAAGSGAQTLVAVAALVGFGTKAGFIPLHAWLPRAHPVAPAHLSALMSGMMIKVALYGLIRVEFQWLGATPRWLGLALLAIGLTSSLGGVLWALVQHELKRLLAYHSIENVGIIALGLGASLLFAQAGNSTWAAIAFAAALLHVANHAIFKTLLFLGAGALQRATEQPRSGSPRWPAAQDAVDGRRIPDRLYGDRGAAAAERLRVRVAGASVPASRRVPSAARRRACWCSCARGSGSDGSTCAALLRQGCRARAARPATTSRVRGRGRPARRHAGRHELARADVHRPRASPGPGLADARRPGPRGYTALCWRGMRV